MIGIPIAIVLIIVFFIIYDKMRKKHALKVINEVLKKCADEVKPVLKNKAFDFEAIKGENTYLIKVVFFFCQDEININAKNYWQVNHGAVSSRKKGEKMPDVYDLVNYDLKANGYKEDTKKLYVIYPQATTLMKVINECEMVMIKPNIDCHGAKLTNFTNLERDFDLF